MKIVVLESNITASAGLSRGRPEAPGEPAVYGCTGLTDGAGRAACAGGILSIQAPISRRVINAGLDAAPAEPVGGGMRAGNRAAAAPMSWSPKEDRLLDILVQNRKPRLNGAPANGAGRGGL